MALFEIKSQKQRQAEELAYKNMIYPLGEKQIKWEEEILNKIFANQKKNITQFKYMLIVVRENLIRKQLNEEGYDNSNSELYEKNNKKLIKRLKIKDDELKYIVSLARIENDAADAKKLPSIEDVVKKILINNQANI